MLFLLLFSMKNEKYVSMNNKTADLLKLADQSTMERNLTMKKVCVPASSLVEMGAIKKQTC